MQAEYSEVANSSEELSSPPASPQPNGNVASSQDTIHVAPARASGTPVPAANGHAAGPAPAAKVKRQRKPREPKKESDAPVRVRQPRKPRVKAEDGAAAAPASTTASRKRQAKEEAQVPDASAALRQSTIQFSVPNPPNADAPVQAHAQPQPSYAQPPSHAQPQPHVQPHPPAPLPPPQPQQINANPVVRNSLPPSNATAPLPRPLSSGQNYDPIRGATITSNTSHSAQASPRFNRASASPSITSLIDPTPSGAAPTPSTSFSAQPLVQPPASAPPANVAIASPPPQAPVPATVPPSDAMDVEPSVEPPTQPPPEIKLQSKPPSSAATPKLARPASPPVAPKGTGSGLLSSSDLFGGPSANSGSDRKGIDIELHIPLKASGGNTINIAQEIAKKYGRDAINPRAAEHRQRLLAVAAAANKIDGGSGADDMSVDLLSDMDGDSNVEMGGMGDDLKSNGADNTDGGAKPRKRRKKVEEYDKDDDFIDDTELAWQEQAAVAKDGFFVYSGPLIPAGQAAQVESTSAPTRGGRGGRGRGRGRASAASAASGAAHSRSTDSAEKSKDSAPNGTLPTSGRGSRGGRVRGSGAPRKPRITKADRERMEAEKSDRERQAAATTNSSTPTTLAAATSSGTAATTALPANTSSPSQSLSLGPGPSPLGTASVMQQHVSQHHHPMQMPIQTQSVYGHGAGGAGTSM